MVFDQQFWLISISLICSIVINVTNSLNTEVINTTSGLLRGQILYTLFDGKPYKSFKGIPYAEPPIKSNRFLPPTPIKRWTGVKECKEHGSVCLQPSGSDVIGAEDCLFLNIYTPVLWKYGGNNKLPVVIYFHGGALYFGSGDTDLQGPDFLIDENIIVVTLNYRVGLLGFLSFDTTEYSGNMGVKDQQLAIQWVSDNIERFGGDKDQITLAGFSAGSIAVQLQKLPPQTNQLFRRTIEMSSSFDMYGLVRPIDSNYQKIKEFLQRENTDEKIDTFDDVIRNLKTVNAVNLIKEFPQALHRTIALPKDERPDGNQPFITNLTDNMIYSGANFKANNHRYDVLTGYSTSEAMMMARQYPKYLNDWEIEIPCLHFTPNKYGTDDYKLASKKIRDFYFPNGEEDVDKFIALKTTIFHKYWVNRKIRLNLADQKSCNKNIFYYQFDLNSNINYYKFINNGTHKGAFHGDDLCYVFRCGNIDSHYAGLTQNSLEYRLIKMMSQIYGNFIKYGNVFVSNWLPVKQNQLNFVDITNDGLVAGINPIGDEEQFWDNLLLEFPSLCQA